MAKGEPHPTGSHYGQKGPHFRPHRGGGPSPPGHLQATYWPKGYGHRLPRLATFGHPLGR